jgi:hypothetical protein
MTESGTAIAEWEMFGWHPAQVSAENACDFIGTKAYALLGRALSGQIDEDDRNYLLERVAEDHVDALRFFPPEVDREIIADGFAGLATLICLWARPRAERASAKDRIADARADVRIFCNAAWTADLRRQKAERRASVSAQPSLRLVRPTPDARRAA